MSRAADRKPTPKERRLLRKDREAAKQAQSEATRSVQPKALAGEPEFTIDFWEDDNGNKPVLNWIKEDLTPTQRRALGKAMERVLQTHGIAVCKSHWGKHVGSGVAEFRLYMKGSDVINAEWATGDDVDASEVIFLRVFFHAHGNKILLLLEGYDKGADPSKSTQNAMIKSAKKRLSQWKQRQRAASKAARKEGT